MPKGKEYKYFDFPMTDARMRQGGGMDYNMGHGGKMKYQEGNVLEKIKQKSKEMGPDPVTSPLKGKRKQGSKTMKNSPMKPKKKSLMDKVKSKFKAKKVTKSKAKKKNVFSAKKTEAKYNPKASKLQKASAGVKKKAKKPSRGRL